MSNTNEMISDIKKFIRENYGINAEAQVRTQPNQDGDSSNTSHESDNKQTFEFDLKPKDIKAYLDRYVISQDEAKKVLSIAVCDHYNHVIQTAKHDIYEEYAKQNLILIGPTGVGKTYLVRNIAKLIGVPFVKADATKFSETGYVGGDVEDLVRELVTKADGNIELAENGIIYLDEIDKIAAPRKSIGRDVSGRGVQMNLLKLMEETDVPLKSPMDISSQLQSVMEFQKKGKVDKKTINTKNILFIVSGAFNGLAEIIKQRIGKRGIGFGVDVATVNTEGSSKFLESVRSTDFVEFGFEPEFIGRLPVHAICHELSTEDLFNIMKNSEGSIVRQYERAFKAFNIEAIFSDDGLQAISQRAHEEQTGARGLATVIEKALRDFKYELPSMSIKRFVINKALVEAPHAELQTIIEDESYNNQNVIRERLRQYAEEFFTKTGISIQFDDEAALSISEKAFSSGENIKIICDKILSDYEYGLNLIGKTSGQKEFTITKQVLDDPTGTLNEWVRQSYNRTNQAAPTDST